MDSLSGLSGGGSSSGSSNSNNNNNSNNNIGHNGGSEIVGGSGLCLQDLVNSHPHQGDLLHLHQIHHHQVCGKYIYIYISRVVLTYLALSLEFISIYLLCGYL